MRYNINKRTLIGIDFTTDSCVIVPTIWLKKTYAFIGINVLVLNVRFSLTYQYRNFL